MIDDHAADEDFSDVFGLASVSAAEIEAGGGRTTVFSMTDFHRANKRLELTGVLPELAAWREEDSRDRHPGGRPQLINDRAILIACLLLLTEASPMMVTEMANVFRFRLPPEALTELGLAGVPNTGDIELDQKRWFDRAWRAFHIMLEPMDAWPGSRRLQNLDQRLENLSLRERNSSRRKQERLDWFCNALLEMTFRMQPRDVQRAWGGGLSIDQTAILAPSQRGRGENIKGTRIERQKFNPDGTKKDVLISEPDADWYPKKFTSNERQSSGKQTLTGFDWAYLVDISIQVAEKAGVTPGHPLIAMSVSLSKPNDDIGGAATRAMASIQQRGHTISRLTADLGYAGNLSIADYQIPLKAMGVPIVTDYKQNNKGIKGGKAGALQVEGAHYCPATPKPLLTASEDHDKNEIDSQVFIKRIEERQHYQIRAKERPDADGHRPMMCPAYGPGATVECPLRDIHNRSSKKVKPTILPENLPAMPDKICVQTSVDFGPEDGIEHEQLLPYGTKEWRDIYKVDRQTIEGFNATIKRGPESINEPARRRVRGRTAQQFIVSMMLASANIGKIARFLREQLKAKPAVKRKRRRDTENMSNYPRKPKDGSAGRKKVDAPLRT